MIQKNGMEKKKVVLLYLSAFILPISIYMAVLYIHQVYPFGDLSLMTGDMRYQFVDYLAYLKTIVFGSNDFNYSFSKNLGGNMAGFSAYYYNSPLNWLTLLYPASSLPIAEEVVILLTIGLSSLSCMYFLAETKGLNVIALPFAISYGLMGYSVTYFQLTIYSCTIILFPLVMLGFIRLMQGKGRKLYFVSLFFIVLGNYYSGYMVCLFLALMFFLYCLYEKLWNKKIILDFLLTSVLSVVLTSFSLLPALLSLRGEKDNLSIGLFTNFPIWRLPRQLLSGSFNGNISNGLPIIYSGIVSLVFFLLFFMDKRNSLKQRLNSALLIIILIVNLWLNPLNVFWHGLNQPIGFPYRYSFILSFIIVYIAYIESINIRKSIQAKKSKYIGLVTIAICIIAAMDLGYNASKVLNYFDLASIKDYRDEISISGRKISEIKELASGMGNEDGTYRIEKLFRRTHNDAMQFNYAGLSHFSSSEKKDKINFMGKLGFRNNGNWAFYNELSTEFIESFFGLKFILSQHDESPNGYKIISYEKGNFIFHNENALPLMFAVNTGIRNINYNGYSNNPFALQAALADSLNGNLNEILKEAEIINTELVNLKKQEFNGYARYEKVEKDRDASIKYTIKTGKEDNLLLYFDAPKTQSAEIFYGGDSYGPYFTTYRWNIINTGKHRDEKELLVELKIKDDYIDITNAYFYYENSKSTEKLLKEINKKKCKVERFGSSRIKAKIYVPKGKTCVLCTIPYDQGWETKVDGKNVEMEKAAGVLCSFDAEPGEHYVEMEYSPRGRKQGIALSLIGLIILTLYLTVSGSKVCY